MIFPIEFVCNIPACDVPLNIPNQGITDIILSVILAFSNPFISFLELLEILHEGEKENCPFCGPESPNPNKTSCNCKADYYVNWCPLSQPPW